MIPVTKPFLPPEEEYQEYINGIWKRNWLTNNGPLVNELELRLKEYLQLKHLLFLTNGTVALQLAIKALDLKGEIITTPFSYVATTSSIVWEGCKPVFVDINPDTFNIDHTLIEEAITKETTAIMATHVYGNPCAIREIEQIAKANHLKVIYDGAHAFGVTYEKRSVFEFGDIATCSFHATKVFHSVEGGSVSTPSAELLHRMSYLRNFGHNGAYEFFGLGINGKNSEFHAAFGLANLKHIDAVLDRRKHLSTYYDARLATLRHRKQMIDAGVEYNYAYYPVLLDSEDLLQRTVKELNANWIYPRRYFYPSLNTLAYTGDQPMPISEDISRRILCLPLYHDLRNEEIDMIARLMLRVQNN